jgi:hypothetical protein
VKRAKRQMLNALILAIAITAIDAPVTRAGTDAAATRVRPAASTVAHPPISRDGIRKPLRPATVPASRGAFDWRDAAIGAAAGAGLLLLLLGASLLLLRPTARPRYRPTHTSLPPPPKPPARKGGPR